MTITPGIINTGLCSVTFRQLAAEKIVALASAAGLDGIEWGTDVHLPPGNLGHAQRVAGLCRDAGLKTETIGSYLRCDDTDNGTIDAVLDTAEQIGAKRIRVWAGQKSSADATASDRAMVTETLRDYCDNAAKRDLQVALEYHPNTLTDDIGSACALLESASHPALRTYWQPVCDGPVDEALDEIAQLGDWLADVHIFQWDAAKKRLPLAAGAPFWTPILNHLCTKGSRWGFLEFVRNDDPEQFMHDAATLKKQLSAILAQNTGQSIVMHTEEML